MSVTTKIQSAGLARDPAAALASEVNALRQAKHVVVRSPGVIESRPNFDLVYESLITTQNVRSLTEFNGEVVAVDYSPSFDDWYVRRVSGGAGAGSAFLGPVGSSGTNPAMPVDYDTTETKFAADRGSLYLTSKQGILKICNVNDYTTTQGLQYAGVEMQMITDLLTRNVHGGFDKRAYTWAFQFVFKRTDVNGYVRRSPPSDRYVVTNALPFPLHDSSFIGSQGITRIYFHQWLEIGDEVECYRSRVATGTTPNPEVYLDWTYTITNADHTAGYFTPPREMRLDDDLGAELYTNPSQGGAAAAKYPPPQAQAIALFGRSMWYGRTKSKHRLSFSVESVNIAGTVRYPQTGTINIGTPTINAMVTSAPFTVGAYITDNFLAGPTAAGTSIPANTTISAKPTSLSLTVSANASSTSAPGVFGQMLKATVSGLATFVQRVPGGGTHTIGSPNVTGIADTSGLRAGMGWTDSFNGPATAGTLTFADTRIAAVTSPTTITLTQNAKASGTGAWANDSFLIGGVYFYLVEGLAGGLAPWSWPTRAIPFNGVDGTFTTYGTLDSTFQISKFISDFCAAVNYYQLTNQSTFKIRAVAIGSAVSDYGTGGETAAPGYATGVVLEEVGVGGNAFTCVCSRPEALAPNTTTIQSTNDDKLNRTFFSDIDEPESVPVLNYVDIGGAEAAVLALVPLRNALLVFKEDGLWRVTGSGPTAWSVDLLDPTIRLIRPEAVCASNNKAYAWCLGGFMEIDENGGRSLSQSRIDIELREIASSVMDTAASHGVWCIPIQTLNLVLLGVPSSGGQTFTSNVYVYNQSTDAFTEWPLELGPATDSATKRTCYVSRSTAAAPSGCATVSYEVREMAAPRGYDRTYTISDPTSVSGTTITFASSGIGQWWPVVGDFISSMYGGIRIFRRITAAAYNAGVWTFTLESLITGSDGSDIIADDAGSLFVDDGGQFIVISATNSTYQAHETAILGLEWHPTAPSGIPVGAIARELQFQMDLRDVPSESVSESLPRYVIGASSERDTAPTTVVCNADRVASVQPVRAGVSRQVARAALLAPYMQTSDVFSLRVVGGSIVHEGTSEKTRR